MMKHHYPTFKTIALECSCCGITQDFFFRSALEPVICKHCQAHQSVDDAVRRDRDHVKWWTGVLRLTRRRNLDRFEQARLQQKSALEAKDAELAKKDERIEALQRSVVDQFSTLPDETVQRLVEQSLIDQEREATRKARGLIGRQMRLLWQLDYGHRLDEGDPERCGCGRPASACPDAELLAPERQRLYEWERVQVSRLHEDERHELPDNHPEVKRLQPWRSDKTAPRP